MEGRAFRLLFSLLAGVIIGFVTWWTNEDAHTHPSGYERPSGPDVWALDALGGSDATGVIITNRNEFSLYGIAGRSPSQRAEMDKCRTPKINRPSVSVRF